MVVDVLADLNAEKPMTARIADALPKMIFFICLYFLLFDAYSISGFRWRLFVQKINVNEHEEALIVKIGIERNGQFLS